MAAQPAVRWRRLRTSGSAAGGVIYEAASAQLAQAGAAAYLGRSGARPACLLLLCACLHMFACVCCAALTSPLTDSSSGARLLQERASTVQLYNANDPYLFAANLTHGTLVLADESVNEAAFGVVAMVLGALLCAPLCVTLLMDCHTASAKRRAAAAEVAKHAQALQLEVAVSDLSLPAM